MIRNMKTPTKYVKTLSDQEYNKLTRYHQTSDNFRVRNRSHAILLSNEKFSVDQIARICRVGRDTVSGWIANWEESGCGALVDGDKPGRPPILSDEQQEQAVEIALKNPRFPHRQLSRIKAETGKEISRYTLKNLLKKKTTSGNESS